MNDLRRKSRGAEQRALQESKGGALDIHTNVTALKLAELARAVLAHSQESLVEPRRGGSRRYGALGAPHECTPSWTRSQVPLAFTTTER